MSTRVISPTVLPYQVEQYKSAEHEASVAALQSEELACRLDGDLAATRQRLLALEGGVKVLWVVEDGWRWLGWLEVVGVVGVVGPHLAPACFLGGGGASLEYGVSGCTGKGRGQPGRHLAVPAGLGGCPHRGGGVFFPHSPHTWCPHLTRPMTLSWGDWADSWTEAPPSPPTPSRPHLTRPVTLSWGVWAGSWTGASAPRQRWRQSTAW